MITSIVIGHVVFTDVIMYSLMSLCSIYWCHSQEIGAVTEIFSFLSIETKIVMPGIINYEIEFFAFVIIEIQCLFQFWPTCKHKFGNCTWGMFFFSSVVHVNKKKCQQVHVFATDEEYMYLYILLFLINIVSFLFLIRISVKIFSFDSEYFVYSLSFN